MKILRMSPRSVCEDIPSQNSAGNNAEDGQYNVDQRFDQVKIMNDIA